jgi:ADP-ribosylglycohydrolase
MKLNFVNIFVVLFLLLSSFGCSQSKNVSTLTDEAYLNKVHGEWLGKCIGGALGMPLECWDKDEIARKYGTITGYIGYFNEAINSSSKILTDVTYNTDGQWHAVNIKLKIPEYNVKELHAVPVIWITGEASETNECDIRNLKIKNLKEIPDFNPVDWRGWVVKISDNGIAHFKFQKDQNSFSFIKLLDNITSKVNLKPGEEFEISLDVRYISGAKRIGLSLDFIDNKPHVGFGPDDDTFWQLVFLTSLEKNGPDINCRQIGKTWVETCCPKGWGNRDVPYLAEDLALKKMVDGIYPPESGKHAHSDAIGGQMKGEICGLICPGLPTLAAEYARRDGVVAHAGEGVYGEQYIAALISASFFENDIETLMMKAIQQIPQNSKYARCVKKAIDCYHRYPDYEDAFNEMLGIKDTSQTFEYFADAAIVNLSILYGKGDFEKSLLIAVIYGHDTDCDCASVGAMIGCIIGADAIPSKWKDPIGDTFYCWMKDFNNIKISDLAARICKSGRASMKYHEKGMRFTTKL